MLRPIAAVSPCVLNRIAAVNHHIITDVNSHMAHRPRGVISAGKENDVAGFGLRHWDMGALVINALGCGAGQVVDTAVRVNIADKSAAIKAGTWRRTAPDVGEP